MTRFLFVASDYKPKPGGIAAYLDTLARGLIDLGDSVRVLGVIPPEDEQRLEFLKNYEPWVSPFVAVDDQRPESWLGNGFVSVLEMLRCTSRILQPMLDRTPHFRVSAEWVARFVEIARDYKPDVVVLGHLDIYQYPLVLSLLQNRVPYGIVAHDVEIHRFDRRPNDLLRRGMMLKGADWIAANSRHTRSELKRWNLADDKIMLVHPPICEEAVRQPVESRPRDNAGIFTLATVCRVVREKGIDIVLRALRILKSQGISFRYVIAGDGKDRGFLEGLAAELEIGDQVHFTGYVSEAQKWCLLRSSDVFVMPSRVESTDQHHEGFGIAFIEANACGIPAVGTRAGGIPDAIVDGETGILVDSESPEKLAQALAFLYHHPEQRQRMGEEGMRRARSEFAPATIARQFRDGVVKRLPRRAQDN
jgi:glycosyltransferase involved in cell wall biosynthesis